MGLYSYVSRDQLKLRMGDTATTDDVIYRSVLENVSEMIDNYCHRTFRTFWGTQVLSTAYGNRLDISDLLAITTLKTDEDDDLTYEVTWVANTDYELLPYNAPAGKSPYWRIQARPSGNYLFPAGYPQGVQLVGKWGYWEELELLASQVGTGGISASATSLPIDLLTDFDVLDTILVGTEQMYVTALADASPDTATVVRGVNGTTAAAHLDNDPIYRYRYPGPVIEACAIQASRYFMRKNAPFGVMGTADVGFVRLRGLDMDVKEALDPYVLKSFGRPV